VSPNAALRFRGEESGRPRRAPPLATSLTSGLFVWVVRALAEDADCRPTVEEPSLVPGVGPGAALGGDSPDRSSGAFKGMGMRNGNRGYPNGRRVFGVRPGRRCCARRRQPLPAP